jgi:hypothetical protein
MANGFTPLDMYGTSRPILLLGVPRFAGFSEWIAPCPGAPCEVFSLGLLVVVLETVVLGSELIRVSLCIVRWIDIPSQGVDG